jgi:tetrahydromethanopterin S-methyltransferase subunit G
VCDQAIKMRAGRTKIIGIMYGDIIGVIHNAHNIL